MTTDRFVRLRTIQQQAWERAPAIRALYDRAGLTPADLRTAGDLARLPVTPKESLIDLQRRSPPFGGLLAADPAQIRRVFVSPGPIHEPQFRDDTDGHGFALAFREAGIGSGDIVLNTWSYHLVPAGLLLDDGIAACGATVLPAGTGNTELQAQMLLNLGVTCICASTAHFETLAQTLEKSGHDLPRSWRVRSALLGGEMGDWMGKRRRLEARYGIRTFSAYATADFGLIGHERAGQEGYVIHPERLVEVCDPTTGQPLPVGVPGEIVVTTLTAGWPLIRLGTGDVAAALDMASDGSVARLGPLQGRVGQAVKVREIFVYPRQVEELVLQTPALRHAQVVVGQEGSREHITLIATLRQAGASANLEAELQARFQQLTRLRADAVEIQGPENDRADPAPWLVHRKDS